MSKKLHIKTYGCQMNVYDSERMADAMAPFGYGTSDDVEGSDVIILNTCHIREKATEKVYSELGRLRLMKEEAAKEGRSLLIGVGGCVAQAEGEEMIRRAPVVDMVFGPQTYHRLPEMVAKALDDTSAGRGAGLVDTEFPEEVKFDHLPEESVSEGPSAFLSVQEGCDKFCTFCVVPYTRGAEFSRPVADIVAEAKRRVAGGVAEITLLGQNVNAYHGLDGAGKTRGLGWLIRELAAIDGLERLRYTTSHPRDMDEDLIRAHGEVLELMPYLHLPVQSGSDRILAAMNRQHTAEDYLRVVDKLKTARPDLALSSDFIVGFPGERDEDFAETLKLVRQVEYAQAYSFKYSARPGTPAAGIDAQVDEVVKSERLAMLQQLLNAQQVAFNKAREGTEMPVLFERAGNKPGQIVGRSPWMQAVHVDANERLIGMVETVRITGGYANSLSGEIVIQDPENSPQPEMQERASA